MAISASDRLVLRVGHIDHGLRPESAAEARHVASVAADNGLPFVTKRLTLAPGAGLAVRAREARRAALVALAGPDHVVALGHTRTDQAETVLMHLIRGAGLRGLAGMAGWDPPWWRPLLGLDREQTRALCGHLALPILDDPSNSDPSHPRVRMREQVLPRLQRENPQVTADIARVASDAADAEAALGALAAAEEQRRRVGGGRWTIAGLAAMPRALRTRVLRRICAVGGVEMGSLGHVVITAVDRAVCARTAAEIAQRPGTASRAPRSWDLRPSLRLCLHHGHLELGPASTTC